jgi:hypothetical protein
VQAPRRTIAWPGPCHLALAPGWENSSMSTDREVEVSALAINVTIPKALQWTDADAVKRSY